MSNTSNQFNNINFDEFGFLTNPDDWSKEIAMHIAESENIVLKDEHWFIINIIRQEFDTTGRVPELRTILREIKKSLGSELSERKYIYKLFPYGYGQQACKIAGMRIPKKLWLDL
ncbi:MAG: TusE/DsrC/DsvC family sulfur relay protein [Pseudomonadota bacterium]|nr:TusE/DsrC/DsvC family sulfur relay protein [Pseudomonadota bacterium]